MGTTAVPNPSPAMIVLGTVAALGVTAGAIYYFTAMRTRVINSGTQGAMSWEITGRDPRCPTQIAWRVYTNDSARTTIAAGCADGEVAAYAALGEFIDLTLL